MRAVVSSLAVATACSLWSAVDASPLSFFSAKIPLDKRSERTLTDQDGCVDWTATHAHVSHLQTKYWHSRVNYQINIGENLLGSRLLSDDELSQHLAPRSDLDDANLPTVEEAFSAGSDALSGDIKGIYRPLNTWATLKRDTRPALLEIPTTVSIQGKDEKAKLSSSASSNSQLLPLTAYEKGLLWYGTLSIGTPAQQFKIDFDTGSGDLWVPAVGCTTCGTSHSRYDASTSTSSSLIADATFSIKYGDGSTTTGQVYSDNIVVAGLSVTAQSFGAASELASSFANDPMDGIMGMGFQSISSIGAPPVFATMMAQNKVSSNTFSFKLSDKGKSHLYLGGSDSTAYKGSFEYSSLVSQSYWVIEGTPQVDGKGVLNGTINAIIDTGTTVIVAPPDQAKTFWASIPGSSPYDGGYYTYPCSMSTKVSFNFGGTSWKLSSKTLSLGKAGKTGLCLGAIIGQDVGLNAWILGDSFLKNVYTTFDQGNARVGFATLASKGKK